MADQDSTPTRRRALFLVEWDEDLGEKWLNPDNLRRCLTTADHVCEWAADVDDDYSLDEALCLLARDAGRNETDGREELRTILDMQDQEGLALDAAGTAA
jgi:hypothetical protein